MPFISSPVDGAWIRSARERIGWSQQRAATELGVARRTWIRWERTGAPRWAAFALVGAMVAATPLGEWIGLPDIIGR